MSSRLDNSGTAKTNTASQTDVRKFLYDKVASEAEELRACGFASAGNICCDILFVKGRPNEQERAGADLLCAEDGKALRAALKRLGWADDSWAALSAYVIRDGEVNRPSARELRWAIEVFDPECVVALDTPAAHLLAEAWNLDETPAAGQVIEILGRRVLALGGFEAALSDEKAKQHMWQRLKLIKPLTAPL